MVEAQKDYARLLHLHSPTWEMNLAAQLQWRCPCTPLVRRTSEQVENHIVDMIRRARGPIRPPSKK